MRNFGRPEFSFEDMPMPDRTDFPIDPHAEELAQRRQRGRELGNANPDARQWLQRRADGGAVVSALETVVENPYRSAADLLAVLRQAVADKRDGADGARLVGVRHFLYSRRLKRDLIVTLWAENQRIEAVTMHGGGGLAPVDRLDDESAWGAVWLDSLRRAAGLKFALDPETHAEQSIEWLREAFLADPADIAGGMEFAEFLLRADRPAEAIEVWRRIHDANPYFSEPLVRMGETMTRLGVHARDQTALKMADALTAIAVQRFADDALAKVARAQFLWHTGQTESAVALLEEAWTSTKNVAAAFQLGVIAESAQRWQDAEKWFRECAESERPQITAVERAEFLRRHAHALAALGDQAAADRQLAAAEALMSDEPAP